MKKMIQIPKLIALIAVLNLFSSVAFACTNAGEIRVDTGRCDIGSATLRLFNHTTTGAQYFWEMSNDGGLSWGVLGSNSGQDTQLIPPILGRMYRCRSVCGTSVSYTNPITLQIQNRSITIDQVFCSSTAGGEDSVLLKAAPINAATDTAYAKNFKWQYSTTGGTLWGDIGTNSTTLKVKFTPEIIQYRAFVTFCSLDRVAPADYPTGLPFLLPTIDVGLENIGLQISDRDCVNDTAQIGLTNVIPSLANVLKYNWYDSSSTSGAFNLMGFNDTFIRVKVNSENKFYKASVKLCTSPFHSKDSSYTDIYDLIVKLGDFSANLNCTNETIDIDYVNRDDARKSVYTYWTRSENDSVSHIPLNDPEDSVLYTIPLVNNLDYYYRVFSKFCDNSAANLDSSNNLQVQFKVNGGQLKGNFMACNNDSVYMKIFNYSDSSTFTILDKWMIKRDGMTEFEDYTQNPMTDSTIAFRMLNGLNTYRHSIALCPDKYAKKWSSTEASTFLPHKLVYDAACTGNMTVKVLNDTLKLIDYTGTIQRPSYSPGYQWIKSLDKITSTVVAGATGATLAIGQADKNAFFKRLTRICSANTNSDSSDWSNIVVSTPTSVNGKAEVMDEICLNDSVDICVTNFSQNGTDTPTYVWQYSPDDIHWSNINSSSSNDSCLRAWVGPTYQYFRRLTYWCPSGTIDSSVSTPLIYIQNLPWEESFTSQLQFGENIYFNCWNGYNPVCTGYTPTFPGGKIWSRASGGKSNAFLSNWGPAPQDPKMPPGRANDIKLVTPAFYLERGKIYRFSFWHKEDASNICWDSLYVTWGKSKDPCSVVNKFGDQLTRFSFDQYNKFWADFIPPDDGIYYFGINLREVSPTTGEVGFDEIGLKEIESCEGKSPVAGSTFAPSKIIDRLEDPSKAPNYDKENVTHQYCIGDTIMLTYQEQNYSSNFDYYGMTYQFWKRQSDADWKVEDTFFKPVVGDTLCHITNRSNYHVMNVLATDTHTWYKIVATCQFDGKEYHSDSLLVNGTHSVPYCENWEGVGNIQHMPSPMPQKNSQEIVGKVPGFAACPTCWAAFPQSPLANPQENNQSLHSVTLPFRNPPPGSTTPQMYPDFGYAGNNVVMNGNNTNPTLHRKLLVMPAMRLYNGRGYRVSFRWTDNRRTLQNPWGRANQHLDSLYLVVAKGTPSGMVIDSFPASKMVPGSLYRDLQSNILEAGSAKFSTFWADFSPDDTATYYFGIAVVAGAGNGNPYRFYMDYFCVDTLPVDDCTQAPKFENPLRVRIAPDGKIWNPGDTKVAIPGTQWCVGNEVCLELDFGLDAKNSWKYGWKMRWQKNTNQFAPNWTDYDSSNRICYVLSYKYQDYRLILENTCGTMADTIGPFGVSAPGGDTIWQESFESILALPQCWDVYAPCRVSIKDGQNEFGLGARTGNNYMDMDFINVNNSCPFTPTVTAVPPGFGVVGGKTYRFSFWYRDNGISVPVDSIVAGYSYSRPTNAIQVRLNNKIGDSIVRNSKTNKWRYYTTEVTPSVDSAMHFKVATYNRVAGPKRIYRTMFDDFMLKTKQNIDALVIAVDSPDYQCDLSASSDLKVSVMNIGYSTLASIPIKIQVGSAAPVSHTITGPFASNEVGTTIVTGIDLSNPGANIVRVWTDVPGEDIRIRSDDTFTTTIYHIEMPDAPTDTIDSVCICTNHTMVAPFNNARWYRNATDFTPLYLGGSYTMDSVCSDTSIYYSTWNGGVDFTYPQNFSFGSPGYSNVAGGLAFENLSKDTILIDSVMVYANSVSTSTFNITITQFVNNEQVTFATVPNLFISKPGKQWLPIKVKIPPGTDYIMRYPGGGGAASLARLENYIAFIGNGSVSFNFNIVGGLAHPGASTTYDYFFNWKLIKLGCESPRIKKTLKVIPSPKFQLKDTARVCSRPVFQLCGPNAPAGDVYTYEWSSTTNSKCDGVTQTGWYHLTVTNKFGCKESDSVDIIVDPSPIFSLGADTSFCRYSPYTIKTGLDSNDNVVTWSNSDAGVEIDVLNPGTYVATAYNTANFCTAKDTIQLTRRELPVFSLGNDRVFCDANVDLMALAPNMPTSNTYVWSPPAPNITSSGTYWVEGTDAFGCKNTDTIVATVIVKPDIDLGPDRFVCGSSTTVDGPVGNYYYKWSTTATSRSITIAAPGTYYLTATDKTYGCEKVDSIKIEFKKVPVFDLGSDVVKCATTHTIQGPVGTLNYSWKKPGEAFETPDSNKPNLLVDQSGVYYLRVDNDCYDYMDSVEITLKTPPADAIDLLVDTAGCRQVTLQATSTTNYTNLQWSAPVPIASRNANIVQVDQTGTYSVSLSNECGFATKAAYVRIDQTPTADFDVSYAADNNPECMTISLSNRSTNGVTYLWSFGDNKTSNEENPLHIYQSEGDYLVTLKTYNTCGFASKTFPIRKRTIDCSTSGIDVTSLEESQIYVFPNPAKDNTELMGIGLPNGDYQLSIQNLLGQTVFKDEVKVFDNQINVKLEINKYSKGEYLIHLSNDSESIYRKLQVIR